MLPLSGAYPLMKRMTYWPQAWLGLAINFGFVTSWLAVHGTLSFRFNALLYVMAALWWYGLQSLLSPSRFADRYAPLNRSWTMIYGEF